MPQRYQRTARALSACLRGPGLKIFRQLVSGKIHPQNAKIWLFTCAVQSACETLQGVLIWLDAEREREQLVCDIHG